MRINIKIPDEIHTALKVRAASESITLQQLIINILNKQKQNGKFKKTTRNY